MEGQGKQRTRYARHGSSFAFERKSEMKGMDTQKNKHNQSIENAGNESAATVFGPINFDLAEAMILHKRNLIWASFSMRSSPVNVERRATVCLLLLLHFYSPCNKDDHEVLLALLIWGTVFFFQGQTCPSTGSLLDFAFECAQACSQCS